MQSLWADFNEVDDDGLLHTFQTIDPPKIGSKVRLSDEDGHTCVGTVVSVGVLVGVRPDYSTWDYPEDSDD